MRYLMTVFLMLFTISTAHATGEKVSYEVDGKEYAGYYISPSPEAPLVLLIHDWDGLTDYEMRRADMLADLGYAVFAADLFGAGIRPTKVEDKRQHTGELYKDRQKMRSLMQGALRTAEARGGNTGNAVAMGYCFGGSAVLELARSGADLVGFVTFHGGLSTPDEQDYSATWGRVMVFHGTTDSIVSMEEFASLAGQLEKAGVPHEMTTYGGVPHAFTVFDSRGYDKEADSKSWERFIDFLSEHLRQGTADRSS